MIRHPSFRKKGQDMEADRDFTLEENFAKEEKPPLRSKSASQVDYHPPTETEEDRSISSYRRENENLKTEKKKLMEKLAEYSNDKKMLWLVCIFAVGVILAFGAVNLVNNPKEFENYVKMLVYGILAITGSRLSYLHWGDSDGG